MADIAQLDRPTEDFVMVAEWDICFHSNRSILENQFNEWRCPPLMMKSRDTIKHKSRPGPRHIAVTRLPLVP
jgi:hypothetical protein